MSNDQTLTSQASIKEMAYIAKYWRGYDETFKAMFHARAKAYLRKIAKMLNLAPGTYEIRTNKGGIAVLGETTLHSDTLYVQLGGSVANTSFYYRACKGRKDYTGGRNHWVEYDRLPDWDYVVRAFQSVSYI